MSEKPRIIVKAKNIQLVLDHCLQEKTEFTVIPRNASNDEWEVELSIKSITKAIEWGMFIKANKLDFTTNELFVQAEPAQAPKVKAKPRMKKGNENSLKLDNEKPSTEINQNSKSEQTNLLSFD